MVGKSMFGFYLTLNWLFLKSKPYIHTEYLKSFREGLVQLDKDIENELELRKKVQSNNADIDPFIRDSSVMNTELLRQIKERANASANS